MSDDKFMDWFDSYYHEGEWVGMMVDDESARICWNAGYDKAQTRIKELEAENKRLYKIAERLETLAVKWVDAGHHDWPEIKKLSKALEDQE